MSITQAGSQGTQYAYGGLTVGVGYQGSGNANPYDWYRSFTEQYQQAVQQSLMGPAMASTTPKGTEPVMQLFTYAVLYRPSGKNEEAKAEVVVEPKTVLAKNENVAKMMAAREIPESHADKLEDCEVQVRPF